MAEASSKHLLLDLRRTQIKLTKMIPNPLSTNMQERDESRTIMIRLQEK